MKISMIVAHSQNRVIGNKGQTPWNIPADLQYFKKVTMGKPVIMGRKTFESIGKPLPGRTNIVVTRDLDYLPDGVIVVHNLLDAFGEAEYAIASSGPKSAIASVLNEVVVIGGGEIYEQALYKADRLYITKVHTLADGDARFPALDFDKWEEVSSCEFVSTVDTPAYSFIVYERKPAQ